jgi:hypothetical protein
MTIEKKKRGSGRKRMGKRNSSLPKGASSRAKELAGGLTDLISRENGQNNKKFQESTRGDSRKPTE